MSYFSNKIKKHRFTMVELLAVMVLIMIVTGIGIGAYSYGMTKLKENRTRTTIAQIEGALESLKAKYGYYPATPNDGAGTTDYRFYLDLNVNHSGFSSTYKNGTSEPSGTAIYPEEYMEHFRNAVDYEKLKKKAKRFGSSNYSVITDGWGQPLYYRCPGLHNPASYDLYSAGADGKVGTTTDNLWSTSYSLGVLENTPIACDAKLADDIANF